MSTAEAGYTFDDLWDFPDDGKRRELIDGVLYVTPMARPRHQLVVGWLTYRFAEWAEEHGGYIFPGVNVDFDDRTHLEPDLAFLRPGREIGDGIGLDKAPDLVVEVSSPSTKRYDTGLKRQRYAAEGLPEFWFVDLDRDEIRVWRLAERSPEEIALHRPAVYGRGDRIEVRAAPGLVIDVGDILDRP